MHTVESARICYESKRMFQIILYKITATPHSRDYDDFPFLQVCGKQE